MNLEGMASVYAAGFLSCMTVAFGILKAFLP